MVALMRCGRSGPPVIARRTSSLVFAAASSLVPAVLLHSVQVRRSSQPPTLWGGTCSFESRPSSSASTVNGFRQIGHTYVAAAYIPGHACLYAIAPRSNQSRFFACADISRLIIAKNKLAHTWDSEWRDRTGFNGHPDLIPAANLLMQREFRRQSCLKIDLFSGDGVVEFQILGVEEISSIAGEAGVIFKRLAV